MVVQETALINPVAIQETALAKIKELTPFEPRDCVNDHFNGLNDKLIIEPRPV